jgi:hypothetical protein
LTYKITRPNAPLATDWNTSMVRQKRITWVSGDKAPQQVQYGNGKCRHQKLLHFHKMIWKVSYSHFHFLHLWLILSVISFSTIQNTMSRILVALQAGMQRTTTIVHAFNIGRKFPPNSVGENSSHRLWNCLCVSWACKTRAL